MNIEDNIKIQQAFVQARIEYAAAEEERQKKIKEKALIDRIKSDPERMKKMEGYAFEVTKPKYNL